MENYHEVNELREEAAENGVDELEERIEDDKYSFFFLEVEGEKIGYISLMEGERPSRKMENYVAIIGLYVKEGFRGEGYGTELIEKAREYALEVQADYIMVSAEWKNQRAREFYRDKGFEEKKLKLIQVVD